MLIDQQKTAQVYFYEYQTGVKMLQVKYFFDKNYSGVELFIHLMLSSCPRRQEYFTSRQTLFVVLLAPLPTGVYELKRGIAVNMRTLGLIL